MAVFPAINPIYPANKRSDLERSKIVLGDGYESSLVFGLNAPRSQWDLTWLVELADAEQIEGFLQARADGGEWFEWQPPDSSVALRFRCDEWTVEQDNPVVYRVTANFRRVFELSTQELEPIATACSDEYLCEPDLVTGNQADLWLSRITAPFSTSNDPYSPTGDGRPYGHAMVIDAQGYSYQVFCYIKPAGGGAFPHAFGRLVIVKRDIGGNIIWVKHTTSGKYYDIIYCGIHDLGDGLGDSLLVVTYGSVGVNISGFDTYHRHIITFSLSGSVRKAYSIAGSLLDSSSSLHLSTNYSAITGNIVFTFRSNANVYPFFVAINALTGQFVGSQATRIPGTIYTDGDMASYGAFVEFSSGKSIAFYYYSARGLNAVPSNDYQYTSGSRLFTGTGAGCSAINYEGTALVFTTAAIYQFDEDGAFIKRYAYPSGVYGVPGVKLDSANGNIYLLMSATYGATVAIQCLTLSYDLTTFKTRSVMYPYGNNYNISNGLSSGGGNMMSLSGNRYVMTMDTLAAYGGSASGGRALLMSAGGRLSELGPYTTLAAGGFTAAAQGLAFNQALTFSTSTSSASQPLELTNLGATTSTIRAVELVDAEDIYLWDLYSTQYT